ncbi:7-methylguanosine phosphate-specific 5'-nucleotidase [Strongyloides ratti]|uniref:5'-nucleotidase n=1 Tax=Strongyloides ratti TaxID=34506 RepID=A0A090MZ98_STRRB|nr:7-methylguanosine phosphate-specific 5'-nucleotidase [Strongyloides ratti]CEF68559.1 7-methylguanosine phosphate-specific 5'-nucleotidase [Strongyloides ratti]
MDSLIKKPHVYIKNQELVKEKLFKMCNDGKDGLMVISDFDYTLSRYFDSKGNTCWTTHQLFVHGTQKMYPELSEKLLVMCKKYTAIEYCPVMSDEEKSPYMVEWWQKSHDEICKAGFTYQAIEEFVKNSKIELRDGGKEFIEKLDKDFHIPLIIFSAGIGNIIDIFFKQQLHYSPQNIHVIANMMEFNNNDICSSFSEPLIHTFCKNSSAIKGDSLGDLHMDVGVEQEGVVLKIGFLNFDVDNLLPKYMQGYDIVVVNDQSMDVPNHILNLIAN